MEVFHRTATERHLPWDHTVLPATRHKWTYPALTPAMQAGTRFTRYRRWPLMALTLAGTRSGGTEGWVDLVDLIAPRPGVEPATFRWRVQRSTTAPPRQPVRSAFLATTRLPVQAYCCCIQVSAWDSTVINLADELEYTAYVEAWKTSSLHFLTVAECPSYTAVHRRWSGLPCCCCP